MTALPITAQALRRRRVGLFGWAAGLATTVGLVVVSFPAVRGDQSLDDAMNNIPPGVRALLGLQDGGISSPVGYLNSQLLTNMLPILLLVFGVGMAAWSIAGDEARGTLELTLSTPIGRARLATERGVALVAAVGALTLVAGTVLVALAPAAGLDKGLSGIRLLAACAIAALAALTFAALAFAIGAATGSRPAAIAGATSTAAGGYVVEGLARTVSPLRPVAEVIPWHWLISDGPLLRGITVENAGLPTLVTVVLLVAGIGLFTRRDLR